MKDHVAESLVDSVYAIYDGQEGALLRLKLGALHSGIVKKAEFYVSCADFTDASGREYDLDFLVEVRAATSGCWRGSFTR